jgi:DNA-binding response OmpR family regulator
MLFLLTDGEIVSAVQGAKRNNDGLFVFRVPANRLQENAQDAPIVLHFDVHTRTVSHGKQSARLSLTQFSLLKYIYENGRVGYEALQDAVWKCAASDDAIRRAVSKINDKLMDSGFCFELLSHRSRVSIEKSA